MKKLDRRFLLAVMAVCFYLLTACTGQTTSPNTKTETNSSTTASSPENKTQPPKPAPAKRLDACEVLPKGEVETVIGEAVKSADLSRVTEGTESTAAFSQCTYKTASGRTIEFFARRSPVPDNTPDAIQKSRETMKGFGKLEDISGVGKNAFWVGGSINQLHVFEGENIYLYLTMRGSKAEAEAQTKAVELARQALNNLSK
jgi:hypothetical protein